MDAIISKSVRLDTTYLLGIGGVLLITIAITLFRPRRVVKLEGIPVMTGYTDHEKAMMDGAQLVSASPKHSVKRLSHQILLSNVVPNNSFRRRNSTANGNNTTMLF